MMFTLYNDQKIIYREYVQNAFDSIRRAVASGLLAATKDGMVSVKIDKANRCVTVRDNGTGIPRGIAIQTLLNIADSRKDGVETAGRFGIGRLSGGGYCHKMAFKTSAFGEDKATVVTFDIDFIDHVLHDPEEHSPATEILMAATTCRIVDERPDEHYFEVTLDGIKKEFDGVLDAGGVQEYLEEVAPLDYGMEFKRSVLAPALKDRQDLKELFAREGHIVLSVNDATDLRKPYGTTVAGTGDKIEDLAFFKIVGDGEDDHLLAWGWYAVTLFSKAIPAKDRMRGMRLRQSNIQLGTGDTLNKYFPETRGNTYFYGEVFTVHPALHPSTSRDGLAPTNESEELFRKLRLQFSIMKDVYYTANEAKNASKAIELEKEKILQGDNATTVEQSQKRIDDNIRKLRKSIDSPTLPAAAKWVARTFLDKGEKALEQLPKNPSASAPPSAQPVTYQASTVGGKPAGVRESPVAPPIPTPTPIPAPAPPRLGQVKDVLAPLSDCGKFTEKEITLVRRVFAAMNRGVSQDFRPALLQLEELAVRELVRQ